MEALTLTVDLHEVIATAPGTSDAKLESVRQDLAHDLAEDLELGRPARRHMVGKLSK